MLKRLSAISILAPILLFTAFAAPTLADDYHYINMLIGDRASGLAGAYTAVSDDPSGLYHNPAGIVYSTGADMSASMNAYKVTRTVYDKAVGGNDWKRSSEAIKPNFFGVTRNFGPFSIGLSYAVPDSSEEKQDQEFTESFASALAGVNVSRFFINYNERINTILFGPSIAYSPADSFSVGLTLYYYDRDWQISNNQLIYFDNDTSQWDNLQYENEEYGLRPILGVMWEPMDKWSLGATIGRTFVMGSDTRWQQSVKGYFIEGGVATYYPDEVVTTVDKTGDKRDFPWEATVGAAWFPTPNLMVATDLSYYQSVGATTSYNGKSATWNFAVGAEYYFHKDWAVRSGFYTNHANTDEPVKGKINQDPNIDMYGLTASITWFARGSSVTVGGSYARGSGKDQLFADDTSVQDADMEDLSIFFSTAYSF